MKKKELEKLATCEDYTPKQALEALDIIDKSLVSLREKSDLEYPEYPYIAGDKAHLYTAVGISLSIPTGVMGGILFASGHLPGATVTGTFFALGLSVIFHEEVIGFFQQFLPGKKNGIFARRAAYREAVKAINRRDAQFQAAKLNYYVKAVEQMAKIVEKEFPDKEVIIDDNHRVRILDRDLTDAQRLLIDLGRESQKAITS